MAALFEGSKTTTNQCCAHKFILQVQCSYQNAMAIRDGYEVDPSPLGGPNKQFSVKIASRTGVWSQQRLHRHAVSSSLQRKSRGTVMMAGVDAYKP